MDDATSASTPRIEQAILARCATRHARHRGGRRVPAGDDRARRRGGLRRARAGLARGGQDELLAGTPATAGWSPRTSVQQAELAAARELDEDVA
jgi:hypothetical protein